MMRRGLMAVWVLGCASLAWSQEVTFTYRTPKAGEKQKEISLKVMDLKMEIKAGGKVVKSSRMTSTEKGEETKTILEADGKVMRKVRVEFGEMKEDKSDSDEGKSTKVEPVSGKSYTVERKGEKLEILGDQGREVTEPERKFLEKKFRRLGRPEERKFGDFLHGKKVKIGERISLPGKVLEEMFGDKDDDGGKVEGFTLTLREIREGAPFRTAVFGAELNMTYEMKNVFRMKFQFKGELLVGVENCWPVRMTVEAPVGIENLSKEMDITGGGKMKIEERAEYGGRKDKR